MKKMTFLVFTMLFALFSSTLQAQTDVTAQYITNPSFDDEPIAFLGTGNAVNPEAASLQLAASGLGVRVYVPTGWTAEVAGSGGNAQYARLATGVFGVDYTSIPDPFNGVEFPTTDRTGAFLAMSGGYGTTSRLVKNVTLPAGQYTLQFDVYDQNPGKAFTNLFGFVPNGGTAVYSTATAFPASWETYTVDFTLTELTVGKISIGLTGNSGNAGANAHLAVDSIKLFFTGDASSAITPLKAELTALINSADFPAGYDLAAVNALLATVPTEENTTLLISDLTAAISTLQHIITLSNSLKTSIAATQTLANSITIDDVKTKLEAEIAAANAVISTATTEAGLTNSKALLDALRTFTNSIVSAQLLYDTTIEGTEPGEYPAEARATYLAAINTAISSFVAAATVANVTAASAVLATARTAYSNTLILTPPPPAGKLYKIKNVAASAGGTDMYIGQPTDAYVRISSTEIGNVFFIGGNTKTTCNFLQMSSGLYIYKDGGWDGKFKADYTDVNAEFKLVVEDDNTISITVLANNSKVGTDAIANNTAVYFNKGLNNNGKWEFVEQIATEDDVTALKNYLQAEIDATQAKEGSFGETETNNLASLETMLAAAATWEEVSVLYNAIHTAIYEYMATMYNPFVGYTFNLKQYSSSNYVSKAKDASFTTARIQAFDTLTYVQEFIFEELVGTPNGVRMKTADGNYLAYSSYNSLWTAAPSTSSNILVEKDATGFVKLKFIGSGNYFGADGSSAGSSIFTDKNGSSDTHKWIIEITDPRVKLGQLLAEANAKLTAAVVGTDMGQYPQTAVDNLQTAINLAQTVYENATATANELNASSTQLEGAMFLFIAQAVPYNDEYNTLKALIATAQTTYNSAIAGEALGNYPPEAKTALATAIAAAQTALNAATNTNLQALVEAATALQAALDLFAAQKIVWEPEADMMYYIGNRDNANYLSIDTANVSVAKGFEIDAIALTNQIWQFIPVDGKKGFYHIVNGTKAIGASGGTSIFVQDYDAATASQIEVIWNNTTSSIDYFLLTTTNTYPNIHIDSNGNVSSDRYTYNNYQLKLVVAGALRSEIYFAMQLLQSATIGNGLTEYPQNAADALQAVIEASLTIAQDADAENDAAQVQALKDAEEVFRAAQNGYGLNLSALEAALAIAAELKDNTTDIGSEAGKCPQSVIDALLAAVATAQDATGMENVQTAVDTKVAALNAAIATFKADLKASTGLTALLAEANALHDAAVEGTQSGQYQEGAKAAFKAAIDAAQAVFDAEPVVQADIAAAYNALLNAQDVFEGQVVAALYTADLEDAIAEAVAFLADKDESEFTALRALLAEAQALLAAPTTQDDIDALTDDLYAALAETGIEQLFATGVKVFAADGALHISGLTAQAQVKIFNVLGQKILSTKVTGSDFVQPLEKGLYIVTVNSINLKVSVR